MSVELVDAAIKRSWDAVHEWATLGGPGHLVLSVPGYGVVWLKVVGEKVRVAQAFPDCQVLPLRPHG